MVKINILIIDTNYKENSIFKLEYIKPITNIIKNNSNTNNIDILHYSKIPENINKQNELITKYNRIIISGNSLKDFEFLKNLNKFEFIKTTNKPILGICAGSQIIGKLTNQKIIKKTSIGIEKKIKIINNDPIIKNTPLNEIYSLHNYYLNPDDKYEIILKTTIPVLIKLKNKNIYASTFHPEIKNKQIITNFINL